MYLTLRLLSEKINFVNCFTQLATYNKKLNNVGLKYPIKSIVLIVSMFYNKNVLSNRPKFVYYNQTECTLYVILFRVLYVAFLISLNKNEKNGF